MTKAADAFKAMQQPPLVAAAMYGDVATVRDLLRRGADVNEQDRYGNTALMFASGEGFVEIVRLLVDNNADLDIVSRWGGTAEKCARNRVRSEILKILRETPEIRRRAAEEKTKAHIVLVERQRRLNKRAEKKPVKII